jgi:hypothetical protein
MNYGEEGMGIHLDCLQFLEKIEDSDELVLDLAVEERRRIFRLVRGDGDELSIARRPVNSSPRWETIVVNTTRKISASSPKNRRFGKGKNTREQEGCEAITNTIM